MAKGEDRQSFVTYARTQRIERTIHCHLVPLERPLVAESGPSKQLIFASLNVCFREKQTLSLP